jgi:hypothetical protein
LPTLKAGLKQTLFWRLYNFKIKIENCYNVNQIAHFGRNLPISGETLMRRKIMGQATVKQNEKAVITYTFTKADGTPGAVEGVPVITVSNPDVATLVVAADGMSCEVTWNGTATGIIVESTSDGDLGSGVFPIVVQDTLDFEAPMGATGGASSISVVPV